jgi:hypothetical protein
MRHVVDEYFSLLPVALRVADSDFISPGSSRCNSLNPSRLVRRGQNAARLLSQ